MFVTCEFSLHRHKIYGLRETGVCSERAEIGAPRKRGKKKMGSRTNFYKNPSISYKKDLNLSSALQNLRGNYSNSSCFLLRLLFDCRRKQKRVSHSVIWLLKLLLSFDWEFCFSSSSLKAIRLENLEQLNLLVSSLIVVIAYVTQIA